MQYNIPGAPKPPKSVLADAFGLEGDDADNFDRYMGLGLTAAGGIAGGIVGGPMGAGIGMSAAGSLNNSFLTPGAKGPVSAQGGEMGMHQNPSNASSGIGTSSVESSMPDINTAAARRGGAIRRFAFGGYNTSNPMGASMQGVGNFPNGMPMEQGQMNPFGGYNQTYGAGNLQSPAILPPQYSQYEGRTEEGAQYLKDVQDSDRRKQALHSAGLEALQLQSLNKNLNRQYRTGGHMSNYADGGSTLYDTDAPWYENMLNIGAKASQPGGGMGLLAAGANQAGFARGGYLNPHKERRRYAEGGDVLNTVAGMSQPGAGINMLSDLIQGQNPLDNPRGLFAEGGNVPSSHHGQHPKINPEILAYLMEMLSQGGEEGEYGDEEYYNPEGLQHFDEGGVAQQMPQPPAQMPPSQGLPQAAMAPQQGGGVKDHLQGAGINAAASGLGSLFQGLNKGLTGGGFNFKDMGKNIASSMGNSLMGSAQGALTNAMSSLGGAAGDASGGLGAMASKYVPSSVSNFAHSVGNAMPQEVSNDFNTLMSSGKNAAMGAAQNAASKYVPSGLMPQGQAQQNANAEFRNRLSGSTAPVQHRYRGGHIYEPRAYARGGRAWWL